MLKLIIKNSNFLNILGKKQTKQTVKLTAKDELFAQLPKDFELIKKPMEIYYWFYFKPTESVAKKLQLYDGVGPKLTHPTLTSMIEKVDTALDGIVIDGTANIVRCEGSKFYSEKESEIQITIFTKTEKTEGSYYE